jgi:GWxTD domain-containing protein
VGVRIQPVKGSTALLALLLVGVAAISAAQTHADDEDWSKSPEAYLLTSEERREWRELDSSASRERFKVRYWLKRDPTPRTPPNEVRDLVRNRIRTADARYRIEKTPGSRTAQGFVFVVFGTPARVQEQHAVERGPSRRTAPGEPAFPVGLIEGTETVTTWRYERDRTPRVLEALGIPTLSINFVIEPNGTEMSYRNPAS